MRVAMTLAALGAAILAAACESPTANQMSSAASDGATLAAVSVEVGALGEYLPPAWAQLRAQLGDSAAQARLAELERLRLELQTRVRSGDDEAAAQARLRLRLAAAEMIRAALGEGPLADLGARCDSSLERFRAEIRERARVGRDTAGEQEQLRSMIRLQEQVRLASDGGHHAEALEFAARLREQLGVRAR